MATNDYKGAVRTEGSKHHSAIDEFTHDERRPAVLLLGALVLAAVFFAFGILVGRLTASPTPSVLESDSIRHSASGADATPSPHDALPAVAGAPSPASPARDRNRRFALLIATYRAPEDAQPLINNLKTAGYTNVRIREPRATDHRQMFAVLVGRFTRDEAREAAVRLRATGDPRLKNTRVVEDSES